MTITLSTHWIPFLATVALLVVMFRPYEQNGDWDFGIVFRLFWLIPIAFVWVIYFAACYYWELHHKL